jgi:hypothetical protein
MKVYWGSGDVVHDLYFIIFEVVRPSGYFETSQTGREFLD